ncbi:hypothetical protein Tco_1015662 [Tanacetum coccineum]|uniref:Uncharacterized protein n=1 Tax=Tanacetum coccineum TaxID=301880 RepID=A0ABQ5FNA8_9ASTR
MTVDDLLQLVPKLITKVDSLETELKQTKLTIGKALVKLLKKKFHSKYKGRNLQEEGLDEMVRNMMKDKSESVDKGKRYKRRKESKRKDIDTSFKDISTSFEDISTGFEEVNIGGLEVSTAPKRTKEQIQQEEASLAEAIRLQTLEEEETANTSSFAQHYTEEDWDAIRAKLEANAELTKNVLGKEFPEEDFAKKIVELVN